jgi:hypothetical protein
MFTILACALTMTVSQGLNDDWYVFAPQNDHGPSAIGMEDWLERPAGKRGGVRIRRDRLVLEDGTPIKFWGVNNNNLHVAPAKTQAPVLAQRLAKYGVNSVRFHKWTWSGDQGVGDEQVSTQVDPEKMDRVDFYVNELKRRGIYHGWSHIFGQRVRPGDRNRVLAYDEIVNAPKPSYLDDSTYGLVMFAPDLQDLNIELTVNLLKHRNPYTGKTYAEEPSLAFVELQNEDNIFFPSTQGAVDAAPTYRKLFCEQFSDWLRKKYGSEEALVRVWGPRGLNAFPNLQKDESLAKRNIYPIANQGYYSPESLEQNAHARQRLVDNARFLFETQQAFYKRFIRAIRQAGYKGPIVGSPWQAGSGISHYYNLLSDADAGLVDRHNYFGGPEGWDVQPGPFQSVSSLGQPGGHLLSTGLQQVAGHPFQLSEWSHMVPNEWRAEGPVVIAAYGLGLQGWDGSFQFSNTVDNFGDTVQDWGPWVVDSPLQLGQYPVLARMIYRGDVREGRPLPTRNVSLQELHAGRLGFSDRVRQEGDRKSFSGIVPPEALAVGKVEVRFTKNPVPTVVPTLPTGDVLKSNTDQLAWHRLPQDQGYVTIDTPGTKGVTGFAGGRTFDLGGVRVAMETPFASLLLSSADRNRPINRASRLIVTAVARERNTGMRYSEDGKRLEVVGSAPRRLEPVRASITLLGNRLFTVFLLDHDGRRTTRAVAAEGRTFRIDGNRDQTPYYEVVFH